VHLAMVHQAAFRLDLTLMEAVETSLSQEAMAAAELLAVTVEVMGVLPEMVVAVLIMAALVKVFWWVAVALM